MPKFDTPYDETKYKILDSVDTGKFLIELYRYDTYPYKINIKKYEFFKGKMQPKALGCKMPLDEAAKVAEGIKKLLTDAKKKGFEDKAEAETEEISEGETEDGCPF